ncbi:MAG: trigger factor [Clostridia bacterium]|nr:trigger factor [Clostridia bacterium]
MSSTLEKKENNVVTLAIDIPVEDFRKAMSQAYIKNAGRFSVPGFRKGKAPMGLVTKYYGEGVLYDDAIDLAANPAYQEAVREHGLDPVSRPEIDIKEIGGDKGLRFTVSVTVKPEVTLGQYKGVEAVKPSYPVTEAEIDAEVERMRDRNSRLVPVEGRPAADGDTANIDYEGFVDGVAFDGGKGAEYDLRIGSGTFIPGFEEQLVGRNAGDECEVNVTFPEEYGNADLKGKQAVFKVKVNSIKVKELPELDDEFAKDVSEFDTLEAYRESIRVKREEGAVARARAEFENNVVKAVVANATVDVPDVMVENELDSMIENQSMEMRYQGIELDTYLQYMGKTREEFREGLRTAAAERVRTNLVLEAIVKAEQTEVTDADVDEEIERMAKNYGLKPEDIRERMVPGENNYVKESVAVRKTVENLAEAAVAIDPPAVADTEETAAE